MLSAKYRKKFERLSLLLAKPFLFLSPNLLTLSSLIPALFGAYFVLIESWILAFLFFSLSFLMDMIDGALARMKRCATKFGAYLDACVDRLVEIILYLSLSFHFPLISFLAVTGSLMVSYSKARAEMERKVGNVNWPQLGERAERLITVSLGLILANFFGKGALKLILVLLTLLAWITFVQRFLYARKLLLH